MSITKLPKNWKIVKLGDICVKMSNGSSAKQFEDQIGLPISRIETIWNETIDLKRVKYVHENDEGFIEKYSLKKNDILFSHINSDIHLGKTALFKNQTKTLIHGINLLLIRLCKEAQPDFFNYQFNYKRRKGEFISIASKSVNQSSINQPKLKNIDFVLPPLETQQAIVSKIEELFSELDKGIEDLKTAQQQLKTYRQSVLKWAFEGKLTNENLKEGQLPNKWKHFKIGEVCKTVDGDRGPNYPKKEEFSKEGYCLYLSTKNVREDRFLFDETIFITKEKDEKLRSGKLQINDVVVTTRGTLGNVALYDNRVPFEHIRINSGMLILRIVNDKIFNYYLMKFITSPVFINQLKNMQTGTAQPQIPANILRVIKIPLPPTIEEQHRIVQEIESRLSVADKMEESISQSLQQAEALRQSILKKAFSGELV